MDSRFITPSVPFAERHIIKMKHGVITSWSERKVTDHGSNPQMVGSEHQAGSEDDEPSKSGLTGETGFKAGEDIILMNERINRSECSIISECIGSVEKKAEDKCVHGYIYKIYHDRMVDHRKVWYAHTQDNSFRGLCPS